MYRHAICTIINYPIYALNNQTLIIPNNITNPFIALQSSHSQQNPKILHQKFVITSPVWISLTRHTAQALRAPSITHMLKMKITERGLPCKWWFAWHLSQRKLILRSFQLFRAQYLPIFNFTHSKYSPLYLMHWPIFDLDLLKLQPN